MPWRIASSDSPRRRPSTSPQTVILVSRSQASPPQRSGCFAIQLAVVAIAPPPKRPRSFYPAGPSREDVAHHVAVDVGQAEVAAGVPVRQPGVVEAEQVQDG